MTQLSSGEIAEIAEAVTSHLEKRRTLDVETHRKHHEYISSLIKEKETRKGRQEQWIRVVGGWGIILAITAMAAAGWEYLKHRLNG
ncbi:MAG: hypothetical protein HKN06_05165 [Gammaproteobacteria bacterium]|nr:hypothetical protein [Gammaproteobacteria bacterium]